MAALPDFLKQNIPKAAIGTALFAPDIAGVAKAQDKLTAIGKLLANIWFWTDKIFKPLRQALVGGWMIMGFNSLERAIKNLVKDTGSLEAALRRMQSVRGFERQFTPLVGGLDAAKQRVAELLALSQRGPFKFEEIATASRNLEVFTRGALSGITATKMIGDVAIASGNGINETAEAVGGFYATLREGRPIQGATEQLRQMGIISSTTAQQLDEMSASGQSSAAIFDTLSEALDKSHASLKGASDDLATVTAEHQKAVEEMKARFGAPWTQAEIQSTKNMTAAFQAITPALEGVSKTLAMTFTGFSTVSSKIAELIAKSPQAQTAIRAVGDAIGALSVAALAAGTVMTAMLIPQLGVLAGGIAGHVAAGLAQIGVSATIAARAGLILTTGLEALGTILLGGAVVAGAIALVGVVANLGIAIGKAVSSMQDMRRAFNETNDAINTQINAIQTLADRHEALAKSIDQSMSAEEKYQDLLSQATQVGGFKGGIAEQLKGLLSLIQARKDLQKAKETEARAGAVTPGGLGGPEAEAVAQQVVQRRRAREEEEFQEVQRTAGPSGRIASARARAATLSARAEGGFRSVELKRQLAEEEDDVDRGIQEQTARRNRAQANIKRIQEGPITGRLRGAAADKAELDDANRKLKDLRIQQRDIREGGRYQGTPEGIGAEIQAQERLLRKHQDIGDVERKQIEQRILGLRAAQKQAELDRQDAQANEDRSKELRIQADLEEKALNLTRIQVGAELEIARAQGTPGERAQKEFQIRQRALQQEIAEEQRFAQQQLANIDARIAAEQKVPTDKTGERLKQLQEERQELALGNKERLTALQAQIEMNNQQERERIRGQAVTRFGVHLETAEAQARLAGRSEDVKTAENLKGFISKFEELRQQFGTDEAKRLALEQQNAEIAQQTGQEIAQAQKPVADSLTRIGGGGGVGGPTGDPRTKIAERQATLAAIANQYLQSIDASIKQGGGPGEGEAGEPGEAGAPGTPGTPGEAGAPGAEAPEAPIGGGGGAAPAGGFTPKSPMPMNRPIPGGRTAGPGESQYLVNQEEANRMAAEKDQQALAAQPTLAQEVGHPVMTGIPMKGYHFPPLGAEDIGTKIGTKDYPLPKTESYKAALGVSIGTKDFPLPKQYPWQQPKAQAAGGIDLSNRLLSGILDHSKQSAENSDVIVDHSKKQGQNF